MIDLHLVMTQDEIAMMPPALVPTLRLVLDPEASLAICLEALNSFDYSTFPVNPFLDHCLCFYVMRRSSKDDAACLSMLKLVSAKSSEAFKRLDRLGQSLLFYACRDGKARCALFLLEFCDPSLCDFHLQSPAFYAAREGNVEILQILWEAKVDFDKQDRHGQTPLFYACSHGREEAAIFLASEICCDVGLRDNFRRKARNYLPGNLKALNDRLQGFERQKRKFSDITLIPGNKKENLPTWASTTRDILRSGLWNFQGAQVFQKNSELGNIKKNLDAGTFSSFREIHEKLVSIFSNDSLTSEFYLQLVYCSGLAAQL